LVAALAVGATLAAAVVPVVTVALFLASRLVVAQVQSQKF
jgi:hypothetical protein